MTTLVDWQIWDLQNTGVTSTRIIPDPQVRVLEGVLKLTRIEAFGFQIEGYEDFDAQLQPASFDVAIGDRLQVMHAVSSRDLAAPRAIYPDPESSAPQDRLNLPWVERMPDPDRNGGLLLAPGEFALASTRETLHLPDNILARVEGKSTVARCGLLVHVTAGFIDPGFSGQVTLELYNLAPVALVIYPGDLIAQVAFELTSDCGVPYDGKYQGQEGIGLPRRRGLHRQDS